MVLLHCVIFYTMLFTMSHCIAHSSQAGQSALVYAASRGHESLVLSLLEARASLNQADYVSVTHALWCY
jgi:hypothetical protein